MSKVIPAIVGAVLIAASFIPGLQFLAPVGASLIASTAINALIGGPAKTKPQALEERMQVGEIACRAIFGRGVTGGSLLGAFNYGGQYGTDWEVLDIALADHRCDALEGFYVGDTYVAFTGDGPVSGYNGQLEVYWRPGTESQTVPAVLTAHGGWSADDNCAGVAKVTVCYKADKSDAKNRVWPGGRPRFRWVVRGALLYNPVKDSTVPGGSGSHRWSDPATREWSDNAELCRYNYDRGIYACDRVDDPRSLLIGRGLSAVEAPPEGIFAAVALCNEDVPLAGGGSEKRYRVGGIIAADEEFGDVAEMFAAAMGGIVIQPEGGVAVEPGHAKSPVAYITDDDLIVGTRVTFSDFASEADELWANTVIARYTEPGQNWADHAAPVRRNSADVIADGGPREVSLPLRLVTSGTQAQRIAEIRRRQGRLPKSATITLGPRFAELEEGDWIAWTSARRTAGQPVTFRIESYRQSKDWRMELTLRQINSAVYSWTTADQIADGATAESQTPPDGYGVPDAGSWTLTGGVVAGADGVSLPAIVFSGAVEDIYTAEVRFEYRVYSPGLGDDDGWINAELAAPNVTERRISVPGGIEYQGAVSYRFPGGQPGERLILGPVASGDTVTPSEATYDQLLIANSYPIGATITGTDAGDGTANVAVSAHSRVYQDRTVAVDAMSTIGLVQGTTYWLFTDDAARLGGALSLGVTTTYADAFISSDNPARHFVGSILTPTAGGSSSGGGGTPPGGGGTNPIP